MSRVRNAAAAGTIDRAVAERYHVEWYNSNVWGMHQTYMGVRIQKSPMDLMLYQDIIWSLKPRLIVEFGAFNGGATLWLSDTQRAALRHAGGDEQQPCHVLSVDVDTDRIDKRAHDDRQHITLMRASSADAAVADRIREMRRTYAAGAPIFVLVDSDHRMDHVVRELELLRDVTNDGDYVVVEDGNINGHPVLPGWGAGPWEALEEYRRRHPSDYKLDRRREQRYGWTQAPNGFMIRKNSGRPLKSKE